MTARPFIPALLWLVCASTALAQTNLLILAIGDPERSEHELSVRLDTILDTTTNEIISPETLVERLDDTHLVFIGEEHTGHEFHAVQLRVLELLHAAGLALTVGLEMIPADKQLALDAWVAGQLDEQSFLETSDWYRIWGYHWGYYREIFLFARRHSIPMFALRAVDEDWGQTVPVVTPPSDDHRTLMAAFFEADSPVHGGLSPEQLDSLVTAQSARDAAMARHALEARQAHPDRTMVLLAGTGHVLYELGIVTQLPETEATSAMTIISVPVEDDATNVSASVADFVWGIPDAPYPRYPELGVITMETDEGLRIIHVEPESPADSAGLAAGDVLTRFGETSLAQKRDLSESLANVSWGDEVSLGLLRNDEYQELAIAFRR